MSFTNLLFPRPVNNNPELQSDFSASRLLGLLLSFLQLAGLLFIIEKLQIERSSGISSLTTIILGSFVICNILPLRYRAAVMMAASVSVIYTAFGIVSGSVMIIGGLLLIGCCHLPVKIGYRMALLLVAGAGMAVLRTGEFYAPRAGVVMPYLAAMFMFRIVIYLYELSYGNVRATFWQRLSYFFLFPNHCFLLFPIIDFKAFLKSSYQRTNQHIWQKGIRWMLRGVIHLLGYRIIYSVFLINSNQVTDLLTLLQYITSSYALILRLSGLFHLIIGLLGLFGFDLHPVFNNYLLGTSFVDMWRRINIYWREFIMKIFFVPLYFLLKKRVKVNLLALVMPMIFIITWAMHNYQWFWIRGYFPLAAKDVIFWGTLGFCITVNSLWVEHDFKKRKKKPRPLIRYPLNVLKMAGLFLFMSILWALWGSDSVAEWLFLLSKGSRASTFDLLLVAGGLCVLVGLGSLLQRLLLKPRVKNIVNIPPHRTYGLTVPIILIMFLCSVNGARAKFPPRVNDFLKIVMTQDNDKTSQANERGYYKALLDGEELTDRAPWEVNLQRPNRIAALDRVYRGATELLPHIFRPNVNVEIDDYRLTTNSWGMRDKEYSLQKPPGTFRIALLGGSYESGAGVNNNEVFENLVEERLNREQVINAYRSIEILNFAVPGYHLPQQVELCKTKVFRFHPSGLIYVAHSGENSRLKMFFSELIRAGIGLKYPFLEKIKSRSGVRQSQSIAEIEERVTPYLDSIILWSYNEIAAACREKGATPVWAYLPATADAPEEAQFVKIRAYAQQAGFIIIDLRNVYKNLDRRRISLSEKDSHPNAEGHRIIAGEFYQELIKNKSLIFTEK